MTKRTAIVWFRRDLRLADNPALQKALATHDRIIPVYIHAPDEEGNWAPGAASNWWLHESLAKLDEDLHKLGSRLFLFKGESYTCLKKLVATCNAEAVFWNRLYEPSLIKRDATIKSRLKSDGLACHSFNASLLNEPHTVESNAGTPYKVFSAYWRKVQPRIHEMAPPLPVADKILSPRSVKDCVSLNELELLPTINWYGSFADSWQPGEAGAQQKLADFIDGNISDFKTARDIPSSTGTSRLSPHLHFGEISPRQIVWSALVQCQQNLNSQAGMNHFFSEISWREFACYLMYHYPHTINKSLDTRFDNAGWVDAKQNIELLERWKTGQTGIPIVDAGMRELWHTGWMHNRVRMIVASILTKNLGIHWLEGARWFWDTLVDADLASNTLGWQWTAGCGVDAAPYFRVFSPARQTERFDPEGKYITRWVPELAGADRKTLQFGLTSFNQITGYPPPMIDLAATRLQALAHWDAIRNLDKEIA